MPKCSDLLARLSEFLVDISEDPLTSRYFSDKADALQEEIELWLEGHEDDCGED